MVLGRNVGSMCWGARASIVVAIGLTVALSGCSDSSDSRAAATTSTADPAPTNSVSSGTSTPLPTPSTSAVRTSARTTTGPARSTSAAPSPSEISLPPNLCAATDKAQNTADAYMGALSAGNEKEALACVLPGAVSTATTKALLAHQSQTAVYLPVDGQDGPTVFGYAGNGKKVLVTVTRERDGKTWVTKVVVH